jgi:predicted DNA-binding transcriptional regulator AlpA
MTDKEVITYKGIRQQLGIPYSRTQLGRLIEAGKFPRPFKLNDFRGSPVVFWKHEVIAWLEARAKQAA